MQSATTKTIAEKGREIMVDLAIGLGIPLLEIGLGMFVHVICAQILSLIIAQDMLFKVSFQYLRGHRLLPGDLQHTYHLSPGVLFAGGRWIAVYSLLL